MRIPSSSAPSIPSFSLHWLLFGQSMEKAEQPQVLTQNDATCDSDHGVSSGGFDVNIKNESNGQRSGQEVGLSRWTRWNGVLVGRFEQC